MSADFINDLLEATQRVFSSDRANLKEVLIISGVPDATQNVRYLSYNRQVYQEGGVRKAFSAVALINNRRAVQWLLQGHFKKISQLIFSPRWTRNELDLFINALRCSPDVMALLASSEASYSLLGIVEIEGHKDKGIFKRWLRHIRPALIVPGIKEADLKRIIEFERANEIRKSRK